MTSAIAAEVSPSAEQGVVTEQAAVKTTRSFHYLRVLPLKYSPEIKPLPREAAVNLVPGKKTY